MICNRYILWKIIKHLFGQSSRKMWFVVCAHFVKKGHEIEYYLLWDILNYEIIVEGDTTCFLSVLRTLIWVHSDLNNDFTEFLMKIK